MKKLTLAFVVMATIWGCKSKTRVNKKVEKISQKSAAPHKADKEKKLAAAALPKALKAKYEELAVRIECLKRTQKDPKILHDAMKNSFAESGITEKQYNYTIPRLKIDDSAFVERLAAKVSACVRETIPQRPQNRSPESRNQ